MAAVGLAAFSCTIPDYQFDAEPPETCHNNALDGDETSVDCGGSCDPCSCDEDEDCPGEEPVCVMGACRDPCENGGCATCDDKKQNGDETDEDCGGSCEQGCAIGKKCNVGDDCVELVCDETCQPPTCDDGVKNGFEAWTDCGAECPDQCANGRPCAVDDDCQSDTCVETASEMRQCAPPLCENRIHDADEGESDTDCGGPCPDCDVGDSCGDGSDCIHGVCGDDDECAAAACDDEVWNGDETDEDCGGSDMSGCPDCPAGAKCEVDEDCSDGVCTDEECQEPACDDDVTNGSESDEDCGGTCDGCPWGKRCDENRDCEDRICDQASKTCVSCDDNLQNGTELGTDCGGDDCALCLPGADCTEDAACLNYRCDGGECVPGLALDYKCHQCGETPDDHIKFTLILHNSSDEPIDVSDVTVRYYLTAEMTNVDYVCAFDGQPCGPPVLEALETSTHPGATHHIATLIGPTADIPAGGSAELEITLRLLSSVPDMVQSNDYSYDGANVFQQDYQRITLHREGTLIWGILPE